MSTSTNADNLAPALQASASISAQGTPIPNDLPVFLSKSFEIQSAPTHLWVQLFADQIVMGCSQLEGGKIGTFIHIDIEETMIDNKTRYHIQTLLGKRDDALLGVYARRILEQIASLRTSRSQLCPPLLLGISLKEQGKDPKVFTAIVDLAVKLYKEAVQIAAKGGR